MDTHLASEVTSLVMCWLLTRTDGKQFRFTSASVSLPIDIGDGKGEQTYSASEGFSRQNIQNDAELTVNNTQVLGVFDSSQLDELELRRGLFDFASVRIFIVNEQDLSAASGIIRMMRGTLGEAVVTPQGFFSIELDSMEVVYTQELEERYSKDCRADLGDVRCRVPIDPPLLSRGAAVTSGDFHKVIPALDHVALLVPMENSINQSAGDASDRGGMGHVETVGSQVTLQGTTALTGDFSAAMAPTAAHDPSDSFISYPDDPELSLPQLFTLEGRIQLDDLTQAFQVALSKWTAAGDQREYYLARNGANLEFGFTTDGTAGTIATKSGAFTFVVDTEYHVAVSRDGSDDVRLWVDGAQVGSTSNDSSGVFAGISPVFLGKHRDNGGDDAPMTGFLDEVRITTGKAQYVAGFTPAEPHPSIDQFDQEDLVNRIYEVTTAGTTAAVQPAYDTVVGNTTADGSAVLTAREAWTRHAEVTAVDPTEPRRKFTVTEYTPNTAHAATDRVLTTVGFPDDHLNFGGVRFDTGANAGRAMEVRDFVSGGTQDIELFSDMPFDVSVGDKLAAFPGCEKRLVEDCAGRFANAVNHVGETFTGTADVMGQYPDAR